MKEDPLPSDPASVEDLEQHSVDFALLAIFSKELQRQVLRLEVEMWKRLYEIAYEWWTPGMDVD